MVINKKVFQQIQKNIILLSNNTNITNHIKKINFKTKEKLKKEIYRKIAEIVIMNSFQKYACRLKLELNYDLGSF